MVWKVVEKKIGRAGGLKKRTAKQKEWDSLYGEGKWAVGYVIGDEFVPQKDALENIYYRSYEAFFEQHPEEVEELIHLAKSLRNPHAEATTGVDLQVPAVMNYLERHGLKLQGREVVSIGSWRSKTSHPISIRLSPLTIPVIGNPDMTLEDFWQKEKCLTTWEE